MRGQLRIGLVLVGIVVAFAALSVVWTPFDALYGTAGSRLLPPGWPTVLGTDRMGRDIFSRLLVGAQSCLVVGIISVGIATLVGVPLGIGAAQLPKTPAEILMRATDVAQAFPALLLAILLAGVMGGGTVTAMVAIGLAAVPQFIRIARSGAMSVLSSDYVLAARACGSGRLTIARTHVLPNIAPLVGVQASVTFAMAILAEAALSYLGLGTQPPKPSWGSMLKDAQSVWFADPLQAVWPGLAIAVAVLGFNLLGDGLRDLLDPRLREVA
jgi:peptide/nickel transport system permease protein